MIWECFSADTTEETMKREIHLITLGASLISVYQEKSEYMHFFKKTNPDLEPGEFIMSVIVALVSWEDHFLKNKKPTLRNNVNINMLLLW